MSISFETHCPIANLWQEPGNIKIIGGLLLPGSLIVHSLDVFSKKHWVRKARFGIAIAVYENKHEPTPKVVVAWSDWCIAP